MKRALLFAMAAVALCAAADALSADAINRVPPVAREFKYEDGRTIYPSYRTWDFEVDEPGLYVFDVVSPDAKTRPAVREWLDGTTVAERAERFTVRFDSPDTRLFGIEYE